MIICKDCRNTIRDNMFDKYERSQMYGNMMNYLCPLDDCQGQLVELDRGILPIIENLWDKNYNTLFSCEGHFYTHSINGKCSTPEIVFAVDYKFHHIVIREESWTYIDLYELLRNANENTSCMEYKDLMSFIRLFSLDHLYNRITQYDTNSSISISIRTPHNEDNVPMNSIIVSICIFPRGNLLLYPRKIISRLFTAKNEEYTIDNPLLDITFEDFNDFKSFALNSLYEWSTMIGDNNHAD